MEEDGKIYSFDKCYEFRGRWRLPELLSTESYTIEELQIIKKVLNDTKSKVRCFPNKLWRQHTTNNHAGHHILKAVRQCIKPSFCSQAWCKLLEIIQKYNLVPCEGEFSSLHLCEAPGAFITVIHHVLHQTSKSVQWRWKASTLNPYSESSDVNAVIQDDRIIRSTCHNWLYGVDNTGDFLQKQNVLDIMAKATEDSDVHLVTADGSINCYSEPAKQELSVVNLIFHEVIAALCVLTPGGNFVLKMFTFFETQTVSVLYLLNCCFEKVTVFKPLTSKGGNSEVYVVCLGFLPHTGFKVLFHKYFLSTDGIHFRFPLGDLPPDFLEQVVACAQYFQTLQCLTIDFNIKTFQQELKSNTQVGQIISDYLRKYHLSPTQIPFPGLFQDSVAKKCRDKEYAHLLPAATGHVKNSTNQCQIFLNILTDGCKSFIVQGSQVPLTFQLLWGKPIQYSSSVFCSQPILLLLLDLSGKLKLPNSCLTLQNKSCETIIACNHCVQDIESNLVKCKFLKICIKALQSMNESLVLVGFPLLSRFYLGIIWLLLQASLSARIDPASSNSEAKITFSMLNSDLVSQVSTILNTIHYKLTLCSCNETLLEVVPTPLLLDYNFLELFFCYNDHVLVHNMMRIEKGIENIT